MKCYRWAAQAYLKHLMEMTLHSTAVYWLVYQHCKSSYGCSLCACNIALFQAIRVCSVHSPGTCCLETKQRSKQAVCMQSSCPRTHPSVQGCWQRYGFHRRCCCCCNKIQMLAADAGCQCWARFQEPRDCCWVSCSLKSRSMIYGFQWCCFDVI